MAGHRLRGRNPSEDDIPAFQVKEREAPYTETMGRTVGKKKREERRFTRRTIFTHRAWPLEEFLI